MYEIQHLNLTSNKFFVSNDGKTLLLSQNIEGSYFSEILIYEKSDGSSFQVTQKFRPNEFYIGMIMLLNKDIILSGRHFIIICKKDGKFQYTKSQSIRDTDWAEITVLKEFENKKFGASGYGGFFVFEQKDGGDYHNYYSLSRSELDEQRWTTDFIEIKEKKDSYILCGIDKAFIIDNRKIINKISFNGLDQKGIFQHDYFCRFKDDIYILCLNNYIDLINTKENKFNRIFIKKVEGEFGLLKIFKYNKNCIILISRNEILIIQIFNNETIQINIRINYNDFFRTCKFLEEQKSIYFINKADEICKIQFNKKLNYI